MRGCQFKSDNPDKEACGSHHAPDIVGITEESDAYGECTESTDTRPDGIGCTDRDGTLGQPEEKTAGGHAGNGKGYPCQHFAARLRACLRQFEPEGPTYFKQSGQNEVDPGHGE